MFPNFKVKLNKSGSQVLISALSTIHSKHYDSPFPNVNHKNSSILLIMLEFICIHIYRNTHSKNVWENYCQ